MVEGILRTGMLFLLDLMYVTPGRHDLLVERTLIQIGKLGLETHFSSIFFTSATAGYAIASVTSISITSQKGEMG